MSVRNYFAGFMYKDKLMKKRLSKLKIRDINKLLLKLEEYDILKERKKEKIMYLLENYTIEYIERFLKVYLNI